ncbi:hypothetical protein D3874_24165 [Oleomonas cavernae]|uniref:Uncharacterized protein n=1 Tax=Oleomonas cavernae TaxID=2320859 RepID=A0A418WI34_9PROT|nr:hypothetical protein [Oleomonas cavernae]RJF89683.1 hypothetical protein D3874_24165 [Oleomonas cavernae]
MKSDRSASRKAQPKGSSGLALSREAFAQISAVEGIFLSAEMTRDFQDFDRRNLSDDERRHAIIEKYGKPKG